MILTQDKIGKEALILDHMKNYGWRDAIDKKQGLDFRHIKLAVEWLAKFHGLSYVLMKNQPDLKDKYKPMGHRTDQRTKSMMKKMRQNFNEQIKHSINLLELEKSTKYSDWIEKVFAKGIDIEDLRDDLHVPTDFGFNAICHLDTWFNNMLFRYNGQGTVQEVLFLDFQGSGYCNVGNDLAMLMLCSTTKQFRDKYLQEVLSHYLTILKNTVKTANGEDLK